MIKKIIAAIVVCLIFNCRSNAQGPYTFDVSRANPEVKSGHLKMGNPGPKGKELIVNNQYMTIGGQPIIPVMGEIHFSRYPREQWEDALLKMKANGVTIIASYIFWIHHEEIEGQFNWSGNNDFRYFLQLCKKHNLWAYPRIGPWAHGEVRNGGTPDWILKKKYLGDRTNHPVYQSYVERYYEQAAAQMKGLLYKDGGPIIGIQLENEYRIGPKGDAHILWLKQTALKYGMDVPMYTVTGWGDASVPENEVIPLYGGYPEEPWIGNLEKAGENLNFVFEAPRNDENIGKEQVQKEGKDLLSTPNYPYFTCEIGVGNQISEHRRPILSPIDGLTIVTAKIGSGSNLPGYYVFTGGLNPVGIYSSLEENRDETGDWNEYPDISYDFQAAIRETGELAPSYYQVKKLHYFLKEFGKELAPMKAVIAPRKDITKDLQLSVRAANDAGFLFGINYYRGVKKPDQKNAQFNIKFKDETLIFPSQPINIPDSAIFIWPLNLNLNGTVLKYATSQPLCKVEQKDRTDWFFIQNNGISPELCFDASTITKIEASSGNVNQTKDRFVISAFKPGYNGVIKIFNKNGKEQHVIILSEDESKKIWLFENEGKKHLFLSDANLYLNQNQLHAYGKSNAIKITAFSDASATLINNPTLKIQKSEFFTEYKIVLPEKKVNIDLKPLLPLEGAHWLKSSAKDVTSKNELWNKVFVKEFNLGNPSAIKSAKMILRAEAPCKVQINQRWINLDISYEKINELDITGYVQKGENQLIINFPFKNGDLAFAAKIQVEYFNTDRIEFFTDQSWLTKEQYNLPTHLRELKNLVAPEIIKGKSLTVNPLETIQWTLTLPDDFLTGLNNLYLHINYTGDKGRCYLGHRLVSDNYNNGTPWLIEMKHFGNQLTGRSLKFELLPFKPGFMVALDYKLPKEEIGKTKIKNIEIVPEYKAELSLDSSIIKQ